MRSSIEGRGLSLASFSRLSGVPYRSVQDYVAGKSRPGFEQLAKFAVAGIDIGFILTGKSTAADFESMQAISLGEGLSIGRTPYRPADVEAVLDRINNGFSLREWIDIWNIAEDCVPTGFDIEARRRQAAVAFVASGIALDLIERLKILGWLSR